MKKTLGKLEFSWIAVLAFAYCTLSLLLTDYLWRMITTSIETLLTYVILGNIAVVSLIVLMVRKRFRG